MTPLKSIHHINFIVEDLAASVEAYQNTLGLGPFEYEQLLERGVTTARVMIGSVWLVLVSPLRENSVPGRYLKKHGEGFFLMSFGVDNIEQALAEFEKRGVLHGEHVVRKGIKNWQVTDLNTLERLGVIFHLTES